MSAFKLGNWWLIGYMEKRYSEDAQIFSVEVQPTSGSYEFNAGVLS